MRSVNCASLTLSVRELAPLVGEMQELIMIDDVFFF